MLELRRNALSLRPSSFALSLKLGLGCILPRYPGEYRSKFLREKWIAVGRKWFNAHQQLGCPSLLIKILVQLPGTWQLVSLN